MPPKGGGFFGRIGRVFDSLLGNGNAPDRSYRPAPGDTGPRDAPTVENYNAADIDWSDHGPYPSNWGADERALWDSEPNTVRDLYGADEWRDAQRAFNNGWLSTDMSKEEHEEWRERFYDITGMTAESFDWDAFREYWAEHGSASVSA